MGRGRRLAATASLLASAGGFVWLAVQSGPQWIEWRGLAFAAALAAASIGIVRKNVFAQIFSRGLAWIVFAPSAVVIAVELAQGRLFEPAITAFGIASGLALFLARPMLASDEARAAFAPSKFRRSFLAACTAAVSLGLVVGMVAWDGLSQHRIFGGIGLAALGTSMIASAFGVLRMRAWGIALAVVNTIVSLAAGAFTGSADGVALAATALPGVLFLLPIVAAKLGLGESTSASASASEGTESAASRVRIASDANEPLPPRIRVEAGTDATDASHDDDDDDDAIVHDDVRHALPARAFTSHG